MWWLRKQHKNRLIKNKYVEEVIIDKDIDTVTVVGNIERFLLIKKLNELGYPEKGSNTIIKTAKSYVSCALGKISE